MLVKDKVAIVTGGGRGLGKAIALTLAREGAKVAIFGRTPETIENTAKEIRAMGREALAIRTDVSRSAEVNQSVPKVLETWGRVDILVNNAADVSGTTAQRDPTQSPFLDWTDEAWAKQIGTTLSGVFYCMRAVIEPMMEQRSGKIINIGSLSGVDGGYFTTPSYTAAKSGVVGMSLLAARWLGKYGITVNVVNPGTVQTEGAVFDPSQLETISRMVPFRRGGVATDFMCLPQDIANAVLFLASDLADYITGLKLNVVGGRYMG